MEPLTREISAAVGGEEGPIAGPGGRVDLNAEVAQDGVGEVIGGRQAAGLLEVHRVAVWRRGGCRGGDGEDQSGQRDCREQRERGVPQARARSAAMTGGANVHGWLLVGCD